MCLLPLKSWPASDSKVRHSCGRNEYEDYFSKLPTALRDELAATLMYTTSAQEAGLLSQVVSLRGLDQLSVILICARMKTCSYKKMADFDGRSDYIFEKGDVADSCLIVVEGRCAVEGRPGDYAFEAHNLKRGGFIVSQQFGRLTTAAFCANSALFRACKTARRCNRRMSTRCSLPARACACTLRTRTLSACWHR